MSKDACGKNLIPYVPSVDPTDIYSFEGKDGISVVEIKTGAKTHVEISLYKAPTSSISNDSAILEVGDTSGLIEWTINSADGSSTIKTRVLDPDEGMTGTVGVFQFDKTGINSVVAGLTSIYTLTVDDQEGAPVVKTSGVNFQFKIFQGFSPSPTLDETAIEALVNQSPQNGILSAYGGAKDYVIPSINEYIYWVYETNTVGISSAILNGLPLPIEVAGTIEVTNGNAIAANYTVVRTSNRFGVGTLNITLS